MLRKLNYKTMLVNLLIGLILSTALIINQITFGTLGQWNYLISTSGMSIRWLAGTIIFYGLQILSSAALIWGMRLFVHRRQTTADAIKTYLFFLCTGIFFLIVLLLLNLQFWHGAVYNTFFILTRNAFPMITGLVLFAILEPTIQAYAGDSRFSFIIWTILSLGIVFNNDVLKFNGGISLTAILMFGAISLVLEKRPNWLSAKTTLWGFVGLVSIVFMGWAQSSRQMPMMQTIRFVGALSPLTVIPAIHVVKFLSRLQGLSSADSEERQLFWPSQLGILVAAFMSGYSPFTTFLQSSSSQIKENLHGFVAYLSPAIAATILAIFSLFTAFVVVLFLQKMKLWKRIEKYWNQDLWHSLSQVVDSPSMVLKRIWHEYHRPVITFVILYLTQAISTLLMSTSWQMVEQMTQSKDSILSTVLFNFTFKILGSVIILWAAYWVLLSITNRYWFSLLTVSTSMLIYSVASRLKILSRSTPILPSDMAELSSFREILTLVDPIILWSAVGGVILVLVLIILIERKAKNGQQTWWGRVAKFASASFLIVSLVTVRSSFTFGRNFLAAFEIYIDNNLNMLLYAQTSGPLASFISQIGVRPMEQPENYSRSQIAKIVRRYQKRAQAINQGRDVEAKDLTVIFNLSESFATPEHIPGLKLNHEPIPNIKGIQKETASGIMISTSYGGGTANLEYMSLTGMSMGLLASNNVVPNNQIVPKQNKSPNIGYLFNYSSAIHPYTGGYYNRPDVYRKYGFDHFAYLGSSYKISNQKKIGNSKYLSDETAYLNTLNQINKQKGGQFINLISMQNHMPYTPGTYPDNSFKVSGKGFPAGNAKQLEVFTQGIAYTDDAVKEFVQKIDLIDKPILFVFYGDHLPGLYDISESVVKYSTDYFIYANRYARVHGAKTQLKNTEYVGTNDFIPMVLEMGNAKVDGLNALLTDVQQNLPVIYQRQESSDHGKTKYQFVNEQGNIVDEKQLSKEQKQILKDYELIQYDIVSGEQYSLQGDFAVNVRE